MPKQLLLQVNAAPGTPAAQLALARARECAARDDESVAAVFFYFDGVQHAHAATPQGQEWAQLNIPLLFCQSAWQRRFEAQHAPAFRRSSLTDLVLWLERVDQVISFGEGAGCDA